MKPVKITIWAFFLAVISSFIYQDLRPEIVYFYDFSEDSKSFRKFWDQEGNPFEVVHEGQNAFLKTTREISTFDFFFIDSPLEEFLEVEIRFKRSDRGDFLLGAKKSPFWADYKKFSLGESNNEFITGEVKNLRLTDYYLDPGQSLDFWFIAPGIEETGGEVLVDYIKITVRRDGITLESIAKSLPRPLYNFLKESLYNPEI